jgi:hypothetical protein
MNELNINKLKEIRLAADLLIENSVSGSVDELAKIVDNIYAAMIPLRSFIVSPVVNRMILDNLKDKLCEFQRYGNGTHPDAYHEYARFDRICADYKNNEITCEFVYPRDRPPYEYNIFDCLFKFTESDIGIYDLNFTICGDKENCEDRDLKVNSAILCNQLSDFNEVIESILKKIPSYDAIFD